MDINNMAQRFAATYGGAMPIMQDMPSFGAVPPQASSQAVVPQMERPAPAPSAPAIPNGYDPDEWAQEQKDFNDAIKGGYMNKRGVTKDGKMWRGPKSMEYYATNGQDNIFKDSEKLSEWNRITFEENRRLAGLPDEPKEQTQPSQAVQDAQKTYFEKFFGYAPRDKSEEGFSAMIDASVDKNGKIDQKMMDTIQSYKDPTKSNMGLKELQLKDKRAKAEEAQRQRITDAKEQAERGLSYVNRLLDNLDNGFLPESGAPGLALSWLPGTDAYKFASDLETLKSMIAYGGLLGAKAGSPNGASGFGALSEKELSLLQSLLGNLKQGLGKEDLKNNLADIARYFRRAITPRELTDAELDAGVKTDSIQPAPKKTGKKPIESFNMTANRS